ncbi:recombinase family protein [Jiangella rhizosphaerae]|uniref:Recombinase family protein n=1 Tax=Jiangella rhizosphaerae TaxID=2293569 RepID=A0A418KXG1_9ACTN|nr:recombinase family protein [Jiangella rhizosphaerae]RIQ36971.1 recombinase family protein [Jiangella rhizosphaerae]
MKIAIYVRISEDHTGEGRGVRRQREDCIKLAGLRGWTVVEVIEDNDLSAAGTRFRPGFERLLELMSTQQVSGIVAWTWDRLERNRRDSLRLIDAGQKSRSVISLVRGPEIDMTTPAGRLSADVLASVARHEIELKSERKRRADEQAAAEGRKIPGGIRRFGFEHDMTHRPVEAEAIRWAAKAVLAGTSLGRVASEWDARGVVSPMSKRNGAPSPWRAGSTIRTLRRPTLAGLYTFRGEIIGKAQWEPIIEEQAWWSMQTLLNDPSRRGTIQQLLTGIARCAISDCGLPTTWAGPHATQPYFRYRCPNVRHYHRKVHPIDEYVVRELLDGLSTPELRVQRARRIILTDTDLTATTDRIYRELAQLADAYAAKELSLRKMTDRTMNLNIELNAVRRAAADVPRAVLLRELITGLDGIHAWNSLDIQHQRLVVDSLMSIKLRSQGRGSQVFSPDSIQIAWRN